MFENPNLQPWTVSDSRHVLTDKWIRVRADSCRTANGLAISPYYVLEYPNWVHIVVLKGEKVLVTRQYRHAAGRFCLELPCGGVEPTDASPADAAKRELLEETGYKAERIQLVGEVSPNPATHSNTVYCFLVTHATAGTPPPTDPYEEIGWKFVDLSELIGGISKGEFFQSMHICSLLLALQAAGKVVLVTDQKRQAA